MKETHWFKCGPTNGREGYITSKLSSHASPQKTITSHYILSNDQQSHDYVIILLPFYLINLYILIASCRSWKKMLPNQIYYVKNLQLLCG